MLTRSDFENLIPHRGNMVLLERVTGWDTERIVCETTSHRAPDHPLAKNGSLDSVHLIEYGAQAMAIHGGLLCRQSGEPTCYGLIAGMRDINLHTGRIDRLPGNLQITADKMGSTEAGLLYSFTASNRDRELASGRVTILFHEDQP